jgi:hypothetical protein
VASFKALFPGNVLLHQLLAVSLTPSQAWIEASTKGAVLLFTASEVESATAGLVGPGFAGLLGGMTGGIAQAYATMGAFPLASAVVRG